MLCFGSRHYDETVCLVSKEHGSNRHKIVQGCAYALSEAGSGSGMGLGTDMAKVWMQPRFGVYRIERCKRQHDPARRT